LQLVHSDIARAFQVKSLGGSSYFLTFIDNYSKRTWVYFLTHKHECLDKFRIFHKEVERLTGKRIITLWTDNGGKYTSNAWTSYCSTHGINRQFSQPYTPQHNGVAKRKNRTLLDIVRCFLRDGDLPARLWAEAIRAACIITNLRSTKCFPDKTPIELFFGVKSNITNLRVFGSLVYVYYPQPDRSKLDPRSWACIHLSFDGHAKGYQCYDLGLKRVIISKDVRFLEKCPPLAIHKDTTPASSTDFSGPTIPPITHATQPIIIYDMLLQDNPTIDFSVPTSPTHDLSLSSPVSNPSQNVPNPEQNSPILAPSSPTTWPPPTLRHSTRTRKAPQSHQDYIPFESFVNSIEEGGKNITYSQACKDSRWMKAMVSEYQSIVKNDTWELVILPSGLRPISARWIFK
jgi:hypothetical protein